jgi:hypothetical protein
MSSCYLYNVNDEALKMLTVRMEPEDFLDFKTACKLRHSNMTSVVLQYAAQVVAEEREKHGAGKFAAKRKTYEAKEQKPQTGKAAKESTKKTNTNLVLAKPKQAYPEMDYVQIFKYLEEETGKTIPMDAIMLYEHYLITKEETFFERNYPTDVQEIVAAFFAGTLDGYLSKEKQRLAE